MMLLRILLLLSHNGMIQQNVLHSHVPHLLMLSLHLNLLLSLVKHCHLQLTHLSKLFQTQMEQVKILILALLNNLGMLGSAKTTTWEYCCFKLQMMIGKIVQYLLFMLRMTILISLMQLIVSSIIHGMDHTLHKSTRQNSLLLFKLQVIILLHILEHHLKPCAILLDRKMVK